MKRCLMILLFAAGLYAWLLLLFGFAAPPPPTPKLTERAATLAPTTQPVVWHYAWTVRVGNDEAGQPTADIALTADYPCVAPGDCNCDGTVNLADIQAFSLRLSNPAAWATAYPACGGAIQER